MRWVTSIDALYDFIGYVVLRAPDRFPQEDYLRPDEQMTLEKAFEELKAGLAFVDPEVVGDEAKTRLSTLLQESKLAYRSGDRLKGAHTLQDFEALIFKK
jgi:hypothetical protein